MATKALAHIIAAAPLLAAVHITLARIGHLTESPLAHLTAMALHTFQRCMNDPTMKTMRIIALMDPTNKISTL
jgi:hypothetical protein